MIINNCDLNLKSSKTAMLLRDMMRYTWLINRRGNMLTRSYLPPKVQEASTNRKMNNIKCKKKYEKQSNNDNLFLSIV